MLYSKVRWAGMEIAAGRGGSVSQSPRTKSLLILIDEPRPRSPSQLQQSNDGALTTKLSIPSELETGHFHALIQIRQLKAFPFPFACLCLSIHLPLAPMFRSDPPFSTSPAGLLLSIDGAMKRVYLPLVIYLLPNSVHFDSIRIEPFERLLCNLLVKYCQKLRLFLQMHWEKCKAINRFHVYKTSFEIAMLW